MPKSISYLEAIREALQEEMRRDAKVFVLGTEDLAAENSLDKPTNLAPEEKSVAVTGSSVDLTLSPNSLTVLRIPVR